MGIALKIAGTKYYNIEPPEFGEPLQLISDPDNRFDSNAVKVCNQEGDQLGHVPAPAAAVMALIATNTGHKIEELFEAKMEYGENFIITSLFADVV